MPEQLRTFTRAELAASGRHGEKLLVAIDSQVFDLSTLVDAHPGGASVLTDVGAKDATAAFFGLHRPEIIDQYQRLVVGTLEGETRRHRARAAGALSIAPYAEPLWLSAGFASPPWVKESHRALQREMRYFFDTFIKAEAQELEKSGERPDPKLLELMGSPRWEVLAMRMGPGAHLHGRKLPGGVKPEEFDYFHGTARVGVERADNRRDGSRSGAGEDRSTRCDGGIQRRHGEDLEPNYLMQQVIGAPPLINYASEEVRNEWLPDVLRGKRFISLAISEAHAGSDVAGIQTTATLTPDGSHFIVNGSKKYAFMTAVKTEHGLSMLLIPRTEDVETKIIKTAYSSAAGTAYVIFSNVLVPKNFLMGEMDKGLKVILSNFNHERWVINCRIASYSRFIVEETWRWANARHVFGKPLIEQPVIRAKFAKLFSAVEMGQLWLESLTYQMVNMDYAKQSELLAGPMGLLKYSLTRFGTSISDDCVQILGGRGLTVGGLGQYIEQRTAKFDSLLGGSEEVLADLGVRQAMKAGRKAEAAAAAKL